MDAIQPQRHTFPEGEDLGTLVRNVTDAVRALPVYFRTATRIEGLDGGELFNLSAVEEVGPYPAPKTRIADRPVKDGGNNFGRVARLAGLMDEYTSSLRAQRIAGIPADHWILFFKRHAEAKDPMAILDRLIQDLGQSGLSEEAAVDVAEAISRIVERFR